VRTLAALSLLALAACAASQGPPARVETVRVVDGTGGVTQLSVTHINRASAVTLDLSADQLWRALPAVYDKLAIPVTQLNQTNRVIGNPAFKARRQLGGTSLTRYFDCGRTQDRPSAETYEISIAALTSVQPKENGTATVQTTLQATARPVTFSGGSVQCSSTGGMESRIVELLKAEVGQ
jgi:hypothetical protein